MWLTIWKTKMFYFNLILVLTLLLTTNNAFLIEDLQLLFAKKPCIEASLISLSTAQDASVMIDKNTPTSTSTLMNITEVTKSIYEKSVTSKINELAQYNDIGYSYELISEEGPPHNKNFKVILTLGDEKYEGSGTSLKNAQKAAAVLALENTVYEHPPVKLKEEEKSLTPTVVLNNVAMKLGIAVSYSLITDEDDQAVSNYGAVDESYGKSKSYFSKINNTNYLRVPTEEPQISGPFTVKVKVGDSLFLGVGHTIQAAKHDAATNALRNMEKQVFYQNNVCTDEDSLEECKQKKEETKSPIARVYEAAQKRNLPVDFNIISESGKSHQKVFVTQCKLGEFVTEGEGNSKKESKKKAAEKMLENFLYLSEVLDGKEIINGLKKKKKRKRKIIKNNVHSLGKSITDMLTTFWNSKETHSKQKVNKNVKNKPKIKKSTDSSSSKDILLELGNRLNIQVQFSDISKDQENFYTLMTLGVHPLHVCLGKAITRDKSHETAAVHGLKFLHKVGILDKLDLSQENDISYNVNEDYLNNDIDVSIPQEATDEKR